MINCDYFIIGMWIAGIWLKYKLKWDVVLVDKNPFSYKIWESHIPNLLHADFSIFEKIAPKLKKKLTSYQTKKWTIFSDSTSEFYKDSAYTELHDLYAFHSERIELEKMLVEELNIDYKQEEVTDIDFENNIVYTNISSYKVNKYILDCSWPRMFVANKLWLINKIPNWWKTYAIWWYWDIKNTNIHKWKVDEYTLINKIDNNTWIWQIPLFWWKILSAWIVSTDKEYSNIDYLDLITKNKHPFYSEILNMDDNSNDLWKIYKRNNYAKISSKVVWDNYILVWDSYCFADPVFSVWTWVSISEAVYIADSLNTDNFNKEDYTKKSNELISTLLWNFTSWYDDWWKENYIMSNIQENSLQWWVINKTLWIDDTLKTYVSLISWLEPEYTWNHNEKEWDIITFFHEWLYLFNNNELEIWYHWINSKKIEKINNKKVIDLFINLKFKVISLSNLIILWWKKLSKEDYSIFLEHVNNMKSMRMIPIYYKKTNE